MKPEFAFYPVNCTFGVVGPDVVAHRDVERKLRTKPGSVFERMHPDGWMVSAHELFRFGKVSRVDRGAHKYRLCIRIFRMLRRNLLGDFHNARNLTLLLQHRGVVEPRAEEFWMPLIDVLKRIARLYPFLRSSTGVLVVLDGIAENLVVFAFKFLAGLNRLVKGDGLKTEIGQRFLGRDFVAGLLVWLKFT